MVNDAVYIAKEKATSKEPAHWTATGTQFAVPYVFKKLFSKEEIVFNDLCETKSVSTALYLDMNEDLPDVSELEKEYEKLGKQIKDHKRLTESMTSECSRVEELTSEIAKGHNYHFVGKVGQFCPIKPGCGGGELLRKSKEKDGNIKYYAATGAKGYRWMESEMVRTLKKESSIDRSYYDHLADEAVATISKFGDFEWFVSDDTDISNAGVAPWFNPSEPWSEAAEMFDVR